MLTQILDFLAIRYLGRRGSRHLRLGCPPAGIFAFDYIGHEINVKGRYEIDNLEVAFQFLRDSGITWEVAVDVGANIGNHSLYFAQYFERVFALEPNPRVFEMLGFNAKLNARIRPLHLAASDATGEGHLAFDPVNWGGGHLMGDVSKAPGAICVRIARLDGLEELANCNVGLLKIDVEGHELAVLKGAELLIGKSSPAILFEQHAGEITDGSSRVLDWLRQKGYARFFEVRSFPGLPRSWTFRGRMAINAGLRLVAGERKRVVPIDRLEKAFHPMIIALPARRA